MLENYIKLYSKKPRYELINMQKALSSPISLFLNDETDNVRLNAINILLNNKRGYYENT